MGAAESTYDQIIERIFVVRYREGMERVEFDREDIPGAAEEIGLDRPKNLGDVVYSFRYRRELPTSISSKAPEGGQWIFRSAGRGKYAFEIDRSPPIVPNPLMSVIKIPDATPGIISKYALTDEQAALAKIRYNRIVDVFTGLTCSSLQNHLVTTRADGSQAEIDEVYLGVDREGAHYVIPVEAKAGNERLGIIQIEQDFDICASKFPGIPVRAVGAHAMTKDQNGEELEIIALFEFALDGEIVEIRQEKHYRLVPHDDISDEDLRRYRELTSS